MRIANFIMSNLANIWQNKPGDKSLSSLMNRGLNSALTITPNNKEEVLTEEEIIKQKIVEDIATKQAKGWNIDSVQISDRAKQLAETDKFIADVVKDEYSVDTNTIVNGKQFWARNPSLFEEKKRPLTDQRTTYEWHTSTMLYEFTGSHAALQRHVDASNKGELSILNTVNRDAKENTGTYAVFQRLDYEYSYSVDAQTRDGKDLDLQRTTGNSFIAKKLEVIDNVIDISHMEQIYLDRENKQGQPFTMYETKDLPMVLEYFVNIMQIPLSTEANEEKDILPEDMALLREKYKELGFSGMFRVDSGLGFKPGEFNFIDAKGEEHKYMITDDMLVISMEQWEKVSQNLDEETLLSLYRPPLENAIL